jgi:tetratricopeptide (TPR) repeat protein
MRIQAHKKYDNLIKNAHQYLSYMFLISENYYKCIDHASKLLKFEQVAASSRYNAHMYLAEAKCMLGQFSASLGHLDEAERSSQEAQGSAADPGQSEGIKQIVSMVELRFRTIKVLKEGKGIVQPQDLSPEDKLTVKIINKLNRAVVELCAGNMLKARTLLDEVINNSEENGGLGLREVTNETDSANMLPSYLITLLTYFYLRVKNLKMAKAVVKSRRFVVDTDHLVQQLKSPANASGEKATANSKQLYSKK